MPTSLPSSLLARFAGSLALPLVGLTLLAGCPRRELLDDRTLVSPGTADEWALATHPALPVAAPELRTLFRRVLESAARFAPADPSNLDQPAGRATLRIVQAETRVDPAEPSVADVLVRVRLEFRPPLAEERELFAVVAAGSARGSMPNAARAAAADAFTRALATLDEAVRDRGRSSEELVEELASTRPERAWSALVRLAGRRHPAAFGPLLQSLRDPSEDRALEALALLVTLDDVRAPREIIRAADERGGALLLEGLAALGSVGGEDAEAYLFTVAEGHADARVRGRAREALELAIRRSESARRSPSRTEDG